MFRERRHTSDLGVGFSGSGLGFRVWGLGLRGFRV